jgi:hypothetical protein
MNFDREYHFLFLFALIYKNVAYRLRAISNFEGIEDFYVEMKKQESEYQ